MELIGARGGRQPVNLVRHENYRAAAPPEEICDLFVVRRQARRRIHDKEHDVSVCDRPLGLAPDLRREWLNGSGDEAPRVDEKELASSPLTGRLETVTREAGDIVHDRDAAREEPVE
jgi:hypothetical protein